MLEGHYGEVSRVVIILSVITKRGATQYNELKR